jgi:hypothetical protein
VFGLGSNGIGQQDDASESFAARDGRDQKVFFTRSHHSRPLWEI